MTLVRARQEGLALATDLSKSDMVDFLFESTATKEFEIFGGSCHKELTCSAYFCSNILIF